MFEGEDQLESVKDLFFYFAFDLPRGHKIEFDESRRVRVSLDRFMEDGPYENETCIRQQLFELWKEKKRENSFNLVASVNFIGEDVVGKGVVESYLEIIRNTLFDGHFFEGNFCILIND